MKRIAIFTKAGTEQARMLCAVHEQHGEFVFKMEDGSKWSFVPLLRGLDRVAAALREQAGKPRLEVPGVSDVAEIDERTRRVMTKKWTHAGDLRLLAAEGGRDNPTKKVRRSINYKLKRRTKTEIKRAEVKILELMKSEKGITVYEIVKRLREWWEKHGDLKEFQCPSDPTFKNWATQVRDTKRIRKATSIRIV